MMLYLAEFLSGVKTLGPGDRFVIWTQGCKANCLNCVSPTWRKLKGGIPVSPFELAESVVQDPEVDGITISGGEPFLQSEAMVRFCQKIHELSELSIVVYTGKTFSEIQSETQYKSFLELIDLLIAGPYMEELNDNKGLRGSSNQEIIVLNPKFIHYKAYFEKTTRKIQIFSTSQGLIAAGIPPLGFVSEFKNLKIN